MRFVLLVEGDTEDETLKGFFGRWFDKKVQQGLLKQNPGIRIVNLKNGPAVIRDTPGKVNFYLNGPDKDKIIAVIALLDLYGIPPNFYSSQPEVANAAAQQRYSWAKNYIESNVKAQSPNLYAKFRQFFAVHEVEAWLLSDPANPKFPNEVKKILKARRGIAQPETVNFNHHPAVVLNEAYLRATRRRYNKLVNGKELFEALDPDIAYNKCPHLKEMLDEMLKLAKAAGLG